MNIRITEVRITVHGHIMEFIREVTRQLGVCLAKGRQFRAYKNLTLKKVTKAENRMHWLASTTGLAQRLERKIQVAAVNAVTIYSTELQWKSQQR